MANGAIFTKTGRVTMQNRFYKATPDYDEPSKFKIGTGTTTPAETDTDVQTPITAWNAGADSKLFDVDPDLNESTVQATITMTVNPSQANGNSITELSTIGADGRISTRYVFDAVVKTSAIQLVFEATEEIDSA